MKTFKIGTPTIMLPDFKGVQVGETKKQLIIEITSVDFTPKQSRAFTHTFTSFDEQFFNAKIGMQIRFWKETKIEVGGNKFLM